MNITKLFNETISVGNLFSIYINEIQRTASIGSDGINKNRFENRLVQELTIIERKIKLQTYNFAPYKTICILKSIDKPPRVVEKPTIRDKVVLRAIYNILKEFYEKEIKRRTLHSQVKSIIDEIKSDKYDYILRFDVSEFYPSIDHEILLKFIKRKTRKKELIDLIEEAIKNCNDINKGNGILSNERGVPQGLSISNLLSNIYLFNIDDKYEDYSDIKYYRFVDDILVLCKEEESDNLRKEIISDFNNIKLKLHNDPNKFCCQSKENRFSFLGYQFENRCISVRKQSIVKLIDSIVQLLTKFKYKGKRNTGLLEFKLNLRITGCITENNKYGWVFYFSQITEERVLHELDHFVKQQIKRFEIIDIRIKKFVKTWNEINKNIIETKYIPKFDLYEKEDKEKIIKLYNLRYENENIDDVFMDIINKEIRRLEKDMAGLS